MEDGGPGQADLRDAVALAVDRLLGPGEIPVIRERHRYGEFGVARSSRRVVNDALTSRTIWACASRGRPGRLRGGRRWYAAARRGRPRDAARQRAEAPGP